MGIPTLIATNTESGDAASAFTSGIDGTYDEYMFVCTDINPATDGSNWTFQGSTDGGSSYGVTLTNTTFRAYHTEDDGTATLSYVTGRDLYQSTSYSQMIYEIGSGADESTSTILHLFNPSNTTYVKHFYSRSAGMHSGSSAVDWFLSGYFNTTSAINAIKFKFSSGNFDGVIQMYGIA